VDGIRAKTLGDKTLGEEDALTALRREKEAAQAANIAKTVFLANTCHELRTPLVGIVGMTEQLLRTNLEQGQRDCVDTLWEAAQSLMGIINDVLDVSAIESGNLELRPEPFDLEAMIEGTLQVASGLLGHRAIELVVDFAENVPRVIDADPVRMRQIVSNLVTNAVKFTEAGHVCVHVTMAEENADGYTALTIAVEDTGQGIPLEERERIFNRAHQLETAANARTLGSGLGLAITKQLAELMGGEVGADSDGKNGATVWFTVPLRLFSQPSFPVVDGGASMQMVLEGRVLVAAKHYVVRRRYAQVVGSRGVHVTCCSDLDEVTTKLRSASVPFDVLLLDEGVLAGVSDGDVDALIDDLGGAKLVVAAGIHAESVPTPILIRSSLVTKPVRRLQLAASVAEALIEALPPLTLAPVAAPEPVPTSRAAARSTLGARVLLAEDNPINRKVVVSMLRDLGCSAKVVENGEEAQSTFAEESFDIVLMDCRMPKVDGFEATMAIRDQENGERRTPIVALTAGSLGFQSRRCVHAGMDDVLSKPVTLDQLEATIRRWVNGYNTTEASP
ncbi:response regulator, partial [Desulfobulbus sp. AH-315-M07]|nr:response regulator [Desulfobulbus sp. AH-315-M07]